MSKNKLTKAEKEIIINDIIEDISTQGKSTYQAIIDNGKISNTTFYDELSKDSVLSEKYARAKESAIEIVQDMAIEEARKLMMTTEVLKGIDKNGKESWKQEKEYDNVQRSKLIVEALLQKSRTMASKNKKEDKDLPKEEESNTIEAILTIPEDYENSFNEVEDEV